MLIKFQNVSYNTHNIFIKVKVICTNVQIFSWAATYCICVDLTLEKWILSIRRKKNDISIK